MNERTDVQSAWDALPAGARAALEEQWLALAAGGLPCGAAIVNGEDLVAQGRNHAYDLAGAVESRMRYPLQHTRLAHAELNALALMSTGADHGAVTLWSTQHPCAMCAAAIAFTGVGEVRYIADDPSDHAPGRAIEASRAGVSYRPLGDPWWWMASNLLFLYNSAVADGERAGNITANRDRYPGLVRLVLQLATVDALGEAARSGHALPVALAPQADAVRRAVDATCPDRQPWGSS